MSIEYLDEGISRIAINHNGESQGITDLVSAGAESPLKATPFTRYRDALVAKLGESTHFIQKEPIGIGPENEVMDVLYVRLDDRKGTTIHLEMRPKIDGGYELELEHVRNCGEYESVMRYSVDDKAREVIGRTARRPSTRASGYKRTRDDETAMDQYVLEVSDVEDFVAKVAVMQPVPSFRKRCITTIR